MRVNRLRQTKTWVIEAKSSAKSLKVFTANLPYELPTLPQLARNTWI